MDRAGHRSDEKSLFNVKLLCFLGHAVSKHVFEPLQGNAEAFENATAPGVIMLRSFLGIVGYYSRFLSRFAEIAEPFVLTQKRVAFFQTFKATLSC